MAINSSLKSSKTELSSGIFGNFKVHVIADMNDIMYVGTGTLGRPRRKAGMLGC